MCMRAAKCLRLARHGRIFCTGLERCVHGPSDYYQGVHDPLSAPRLSIKMAEQMPSRRSASSVAAHRIALHFSPGCSFCIWHRRGRTLSGPLELQSCDGVSSGNPTVCAIALQSL